MGFHVFLKKFYLRTIQYNCCHGNTEDYTGLKAVKNDDPVVNAKNGKV